MRLFSSSTLCKVESLDSWVTVRRLSMKPLQAPRPRTSSARKCPRVDCAARKGEKGEGLGTRRPANCAVHHGRILRRCGAGFRSKRSRSDRGARRRQRDTIGTEAVRRAGRDRHGHVRATAAFPAQGQPVRDAESRSRHIRPEPAELLAGSAGDFTRLRLARAIRRARCAADRRRRAGDDARRRRAGRDLQPGIGRPDRSDARSARVPLWECLRRIDPAVYRRRTSGSGGWRRSLGRVVRRMARGAAAGRPIRPRQLPR